MSINSPRHPWSSLRRAEDCTRAIERAFFREVVNIGGSYIDLDRILAGIADEGTKAGWSEQELTDAVLTLARQHAMSNPDTIRLR